MISPLNPPFTPDRLTSLDDNFPVGRGQVTVFFYSLTGKTTLGEGVGGPGLEPPPQGDPWPQDRLGVQGWCVSHLVASHFQKMPIFGAFFFAFFFDFSSVFFLFGTVFVI